MRPHIASELIANGIQKLNRKWTKNSKKEECIRNILVELHLDGLLNTKYDLS